MGNSPEVPRWLHGAVPSQRQSQVRAFQGVEGNHLFPGLGSWRLCKPRTFSLELALLSKRLLGFGISRILIRMVSVTSFHLHVILTHIFAGKLNTEEFCVAMHLCEQFQKGEPLPPQLPVRFAFLNIISSVADDDQWSVTFCAA